MICNHDFGLTSLTVQLTQLRFPSTYYLHFILDEFINLGLGGSKFEVAGSERFGAGNSKSHFQTLKNAPGGYD